VVGLVQRQGWSITNVDSVVVAERPKLKPHIAAMQDAIAARMDLQPEQVGVKATTNETLGPEGREEGISCHAVALLQKG
jgi:2-C-methyl-D-erythritol 2,4-cyclodiphosphate synthase